MIDILGSFCLGKPVPYFPEAPPLFKSLCRKPPYLIMLDKLLMVRSDGTKYLILSSTGRLFSVLSLSTMTFEIKKKHVTKMHNINFLS